MAPKIKHTLLPESSQENFVVYMRQQMQMAIRMTLMMVMEEEITAVIGAERYERKAAAARPTQRHVPARFGDVGGTA